MDNVPCIATGDKGLDKIWDKTEETSQPPCCEYRATVEGRESAQLLCDPGKIGEQRPGQGNDMIRFGWNGDEVVLEKNVDNRMITGLDGGALESLGVTEWGFEPEALGSDEVVELSCISGGNSFPTDIRQGPQGDHASVGADGTAVHDEETSSTDKSCETQEKIFVECAAKLAECASQQEDAAGHHDFDPECQQDDQIAHAAEILAVPTHPEAWSIIPESAEIKGAHVDAAPPKKRSAATRVPKVRSDTSAPQKKQKRTPKPMRDPMHVYDSVLEPLVLHEVFKEESDKKKRCPPKKPEKTSQQHLVNGQESDKHVSHAKSQDAAAFEPPMCKTATDKKKRPPLKKDKKTQLKCDVGEWVVAMHFFQNPEACSDDAAAGVLEDAFGPAQAMLRAGSSQVLLEVCALSVAELTEAAKALHKMLDISMKKWVGNMSSDDDRDAVAHAVCTSVCVAKLLVARGGSNGGSSALLGSAMESLSKVIGALSGATGVGDGRKKVKGVKGCSNREDPMLSAAEDCFKAVPEVLIAGLTIDDFDIFRIVRTTLLGIMCPSASAQKSSIIAIEAIFTRYPGHRKNILSELFNLGIDGDHDQKKHEKIAKSLSLSGCSRPIQAISAAVISVIQGVIVDKGGRTGSEILESDVKRCSLCFMAMFEERFAAKSQNKSSIKDTDARAFLFGLVDDLFSVLNLPCFPVAESMLYLILDRLDYSIRLEGKEKISDSYRSLCIDLVCSILLKLNQIRKSGHDGPLSTISPVSLFDKSPVSGLDLLASTSTGRGCEVAGLIEEKLELQQDEYAAKYAGDAVDTSFQSPIKMAKNKKDRSQLMDEQLRQLVLNHLCSQQAFAGVGLCRSAFLYHVAIWCTAAEGGVSDSLSDFWESQSVFVSQGHLSTSNPLVSMEYIDAACLRLALRRPLFSKLGAHFDALIPLMKDCRPQDRVKVLRTVNDAITIDSTLMHSDVLTRVRDKYMLDDNANVRSAAIDLISVTVILQVQKGEDTYADFEMLCERSFDTSLSVRHSVLSFLRRVCKIQREMDPQGEGANPYTLKACKVVSKMLRQGEDTLKKGGLAFFKALWFQDGEDGMPRTPLRTRVEEILHVVDSCSNSEIDWLEQVFDTAGEEMCDEYFISFSQRIMEIHNIPRATESGGSSLVKPSEFNDFQARTGKLIPVLRTLVCLAKSKPGIAWGSMQFMKPLLSEREISKSHLEVLKLMLSIIDIMLPRCKNLPLDLDFEHELCSAFSDGVFKLTNPKRFVGVDDVCKAVKCFATVVREINTSKPKDLLTKLLEQNLNFLKIYIEKPEENMVTWLPRCLILAGALTRFIEPEALPQPIKDVAVEAGKQLFSVCMSHYVNHRSDSVRRCAMHALGSICVRQPQVMLQQPCTKLFSRCLKTDSPPALRSQVLRNLLDHFNQEETRILDTMSISTGSSDSSSKIISDRSTQLIHAFHGQILEASLADNVIVRLDAVSLILVIMHRGLTATYLCLPYLIAQQRYPSSQAGRLAMAMLEEVHVKETSIYTSHMMWNGIIKAFALHPASEENNLAAHAFSASFRLLAGTGKDSESKAVRSLLQTALDRLERVSKEVGQFSSKSAEERKEQLDFAVYTTSVLASLQFATLDGPLFVMHAANTIVNTLGQRCMEPLREASESSEEVGHGLRAEGTCMGLLVGLSVHLKEKYSIRAEKMRKFNDDPRVLEKTAAKEIDDLVGFEPLVLFECVSSSGMEPIKKSDFQLFWKTLEISMGSDASHVSEKTSKQGGDTSKGKGKTYGGRKKTLQLCEILASGGEQGVQKKGKSRKKRCNDVNEEVEYSDDEFDAGSSSISATALELKDDRPQRVFKKKGHEMMELANDGDKEEPVRKKGKCGDLSSDTQTVKKMGRPVRAAAAEKKDAPSSQLQKKMVNTRK